MTIEFPRTIQKHYRVFKILWLMLVAVITMLIARAYSGNENYFNNHKMFLPVTADTVKPKKAAVDSTQMIRAAANAFRDSLVSKTSIKDFDKWLYENISGKSYNEGTLQELLGMFIQVQYNTWIQKRNKK